MNTTTNTEVALDLDADFGSFDMAGVADLPEYVHFPNGAHHVKVSIKLDKKDGKRSVKFNFKYVAALELADDTETVPNAGDMDGTYYGIDNEFGAGMLKKDSAVLFAHFGSANILELSRQVIDLDVVLVCKQRHGINKTSKEATINMNIVSLAVM